MRGIGLRAKVTVFVSCLVVAIISVNAVFTMRAERQERERQLIEQGKLFARLTATDVVRSFGSRPWVTVYSDAFNREMERFFRYYPDLSRITILSEGGLVLFDSEPAGDGEGGTRHTDDKELLARLALAEMDVRQTTGGGGERLMDIIAPVTETGGPQFLKVRYIISYRSLEDRLAGIRREFMLLASFFMAVGIAAATLFAGRLTRPILQLKEGAGEIARGNLGHAVNISSKDEIGELGRSFNVMAVSLKDHRREVEEANRSLLAANEELKALQKELVRSERMAAVGQLAAGLSHEIDNPIGVILGFAEYLLEDMAEDDPRREDLITIVEESKRCKRIVRGLLDFSRPPALGVVSTDVSEVVGRTVEAARSQPLFKRVRVDEEPGEDMPAIMADPDRLRQVFMNLMINAAQAMPDGGDLRVRVWHDEGAGVVRVSFSDTGGGIPEDNLEKVFDPFFTTKRAGEGTGLGLAICVRLLEEQGGVIKAENGPGPGATFTVTLPINGIPDADPPETA